MKFSYSPWLAALTVATTAATVTMVNVSPATAALIKYDLQIDGINVDLPEYGGSAPIEVRTGFFTIDTSMDVIESVDLRLVNIRFDQGEFVTADSQTNILFSNSAQPSQNLTLFDVAPLPQEMGGMLTGDATFINGNFNNSELSYEMTAFASVPEPLTILGSAAALGFGVVLKQEHSRKKNKVNE
ncbi:MAG: PEP-CTERM sorting domain-containing protein [Coleofasciculus sp. C2-GNP5-27]